VLELALDVDPVWQCYDLTGPSTDRCLCPRTATQFEYPQFPGFEPARLSPSARAGPSPSARAVLDIRRPRRTDNDLSDKPQYISAIPFGSSDWSDQRR